MTQTLAEQSTLLDEAEACFRLGLISRLHRTLGQIRDPGNLLPPNDARFVHLTLGAALYGFGDPKATRALNAGLRGKVWAPMRYRLALRQKDFATAARIRRQPGISERERLDFRCSLGLHLIWRHRYKWGFHFYKDRWRAINFPNVLPSPLTYHPLADPASDPPRVVLEQGMGECLLALMHLRPSPPAEIIAEPRYRQLVARVLPDTRFIPVNAIPAALCDAPAILSADLFGRAWQRTGSFAPPGPLTTPLRDHGAAPIYGICWRGGSGQNRREERHIPLHLFLDLLPRGARYVPLQFDITPEERQLLAGDGRCQPPLLDVRLNPDMVLQMIRRLAGVVSVDSANWHFAGAAGVPLLALMNARAHWFWGPDADAAWTYVNATTLAKTDMSQATVGAWMQRADLAYRRRPVPATAPEGPPARRPVLVAGLPRSGTSMIMRILSLHGLWLGGTLPASPANPHGFFENRALKDQMIKKILSDLGADPNGVTALPDTENMPILPELDQRILTMLSREGHDGSGLWAFKDPKLTLIWPMMTQAFPRAHWVVTRRDRRALIDSLTRTTFMARHSSDPEYWAMFCAAYEQRLDALSQSGARVSHVDTDALANGDHTALAGVLRAAGVTPDRRHFRAAIDAGLFTRSKEHP